MQRAAAVRRSEGADPRHPYSCCHSPPPHFLFRHVVQDWHHAGAGRFQPFHVRGSHVGLANRRRLAGLSQQPDNRPFVDHGVRAAIRFGALYASSTFWHSQVPARHDWERGGRQRHRAQALLQGTCLLQRHVQAISLLAISSTKFTNA